MLKGHRDLEGHICLAILEIVAHLDPTSNTRSFRQPLAIFVKIRHRLDASMGLDARDAADGTARALGILEHGREERGRLLQRSSRAGRQFRERNAETVREGPADAGTAMLNAECRMLNGPIPFIHHSAFCIQH